MRLIDADVIKQKYRDKFIKSLVDKDRGIDLSEYAEEPSKSFYRFIDEIPTVEVLDKIRTEIEEERDKVYQNRQGCDTYYADGLDTALEIIDKYKGE